MSGLLLLLLSKLFFWDADSASVLIVIISYNFFNDGLHITDLQYFYKTDYAQSNIVIARFYMCYYSKLILT